MKTFETMNLQLFADAGTLVNATGNYVNAYDGTVTAFSGVNTLASTLKTFYDTELLENARITMIYSQFAKKQPLPANHGKHRRMAQVEHCRAGQQVTEGVIPTGRIRPERQDGIHQPVRHLRSDFRPAGAACV